MDALAHPIRPCRSSDRSCLDAPPLKPRRRRVQRAAISLALLAVTFAAGAPAAEAVSSSTASKAALKATESERRGAPAILFRLPSPLRSGTAIREAGTQQPPTGPGARKMPVALRVTAGPAYFFYLDLSPYQHYQHAGRIILVNKRTGHVRRSRRLNFQPVFNGKRPPFLRSRKSYERASYRIFSSDYAVGSPRRAARDTPVQDAFGLGLGTQTRAHLRSAASEAALGGALSDEKSCTVSVSSSLTKIDGALESLGSSAGASVSPLFRYSALSGTSLERFISSDVIAGAGCKDVLIAISGDGYRSSAQPTVRTGLSLTASKLREFDVTASLLRTIIAANPRTTFKLMIDAPGSGAFIDPLKSLSNVLVVATSSKAGQPAFRYLPRKRIDGRLVSNPVRMRADSSFFTTQLLAATGFAASDAEVAHAIAEVAAGRAPSVLAWMIARSFALSALFDFTADIGATPQLYTRFTVTEPAPGPDPGPGSGPGPGPGNGRPTASAQSVAAVEDTAKAITLSGTDPEGHALTFALASQPAHGTLSGTAPNVSYTPAANYDGPDAFSFTVADGSLTSAPATVSITVSAVDDPPVAVDDSATVDEDSGATAVAALANDTDPDAGPMSIASVTQSAHGAVAITGGGMGLTYEPDANYCNDPSSGAPDLFTYTLDGGSSATVSMTVTCVNDRPVTSASGTLAYTENDPAPAIAPALTVTDVDSAHLTGATVQITGNYQDGEDLLALPAQPAIAGAFDALTGTLTLSGTATIAEYRTALRAATYANSSDDPATAPRTVSFKARDAGGFGSADTITITVAAVNDLPSIATSAGPLGYTEGDPATPIDPALVLADPDSPIVSATVQLTGNYVAPEDILALAGSHPGITAVVNLSGDTLTLTGPASRAAFESALRSVTYRNSSVNPSVAPRTVTFVANDPLGASTPQTRAINVSPSDNAPDVHNASGSLTYTENAAPTPIDTALTITDPDSPDLSGATVQITGGYVDGEDFLALAAQPVVTGVFDPLTGRLTLTGSASVAAYEAALKAVTYANASDDPSTVPRTVTYAARDAGGFGLADTHGITITAVDDPPVAVDDAASVLEDSGATPVAVLVNDTDVDAGPISIASVTQPANGAVAITGVGTGLTYEPGLNYCNDPDPAPVDSFTYTLNGGSIATVSMTVTCVDDSPVAVDDAASVLEDSGATAVAVLANDTDLDGGPKAYTSFTQPANGVVVDGGGTLTYEPLANYCNSQPGGSPDTFAYTLNGGSTATVAVTVTCVPDDPSVATSPGTLIFTENDLATAIDPGVDVTDPDLGAAISGATVRITANFVGSEDILALAGSHPGISAAFAGDTLTLTGSATPAAYQAALRDVTYANSSDAPSTLTRTVTFTVTDETSRTGSGTRSVQVVAVQDPPVAVDDSATVLEDSGATAVPVLANDTDVDGGKMTIGPVTQPAHGTVVITGPGSGLTYAPNANYCNDPPGGAPDTFTYTLNGGSTATVAMTVTCVNDAPIADDETLNGASSAVGNTAFVGDDPSDGAPSVAGPKKTITADILAGDTDPDGPGPLVVTAGTFASNDGGTVVLESDGDFTFTPAAGTSCSDTSDFFDYTVSDQNPGTPATDAGRVNITIAGCVWYVNNNAPGNAGTSTAPFDTLAQAETASAAGHTIFVFDGDNTSTGYAAGLDLKSNQRLLGEAATLQIGSDVLHSANPANRPTITDNSADVVSLASGNTVRGVQLDPQGAGGGLAGGAGDSGGTIDDVRIVDTGTLAGQPALELDGTSGTFDVSDLTINAGAVTAIRLNNNSGIVNFKSAGAISISNDGAPGLDANGTNLGANSVFDDLTVTNSPTGAVSMVNTTGTTTFGDGSGADLSLQTTSGATAAFRLNNAGNVTVPAGGTANVSATGGPAIDVTNTSGASLSFDSVSSTNSAGGAIVLNGLGGGTFGATGGTLAGFAGVAVSVTGGSGTITYPGTIDDGAGNAALITGRTGSTVTLSGTIADGADVNGGIDVISNSGGSTVVSGPSKTFSTGAGAAVTLASNTGHTISFTGGNLGMTTSSGVGLSMGSGGTLNVTGTGNTISTSFGSGLRIDNSTIGASDVTFQRVSTNGAAVGIRANNTGATGRLIVSGSGSGTCTNADTSGCSGGTIANGTGADDSGTTPAGSGIVLNNTLNPSLTRMWIHDHSNYGIRGTNVAGFTLANSVINGANGTTGTTPFDDSSVWFDNLTGAPAVSDTYVSGGFEDNFRVVNTTGSLNRITFTADTFGVSGSRPGNDAILLETSSTASQLQATVTGSTFTGAAGDQLQFNHGGTGAGDLVLTANTFTNSHPAIATGGGGLSLFQSGVAGGNTTMNISGNSFRDAVGAAVLAVKSIGPATQTGTFTNNVVGVASPINSGSAEGSGLKLQSVDQGSINWSVTNNQIRGYNNFGIEVVAGGGASPQSGTLNTTITGNTITQPGSTPGTITIPKQGIHYNIGTVPGDTFQACARITGNSIDTSGADASPATGVNVDVRLRQRQATTIRLPGYVGASNDNSAVQSFVAANNSAGTSVLAQNTVPTGGGFIGTGTTCP